MKPGTVKYKGCTIEPESDPKGIYFGVNPEDEGYQTEFVRVTFPDNTWVRCANLREAEKYIDDPERTQGRL